MRQVHLKKIRVIIALIFFLSIVFLFIDFRKLLPEPFYDAVLYLQFVPSLLKFITAVSIATIGFLAVILLTALFGRVYCSAFCPLGILQDCILWIKKRVKRKFRYRYSAPVDYLRYPFLALPVIAYLAGSIFFINLLDPFSNFGRIISDFFQPVYILLNNAGAKLLEKVNVFVLYPENISLSGWIAYLFPAFILGLIVWMSLKWGRLYCNTICPVGTLLGLLSRISVFRIRMIEDKCTKCGKCAFACKSSCINIKEQKVDFSRCVGCFNCITACPEDAIKYLAPVRQKSLKLHTDDSRRKILVSAGLLFLSMFGFRKLILAREYNSTLAHNVKSASFRESESFLVREDKSSLLRGDKSSLLQEDKSDLLQEDTLAVHQEFESGLPKEIPHNKVPTTIEPEKHYTVTPPGSLGLKHFTDTCTACHLCVSACPTQVLQPSVFEYGIMGLMQPFMDYETNYCNFDCVICSEICPTGAILSLTMEAKKTVQIGKVNLILDNCVVKTDNTACGSCSEHCPTQAVRMVPYIGELTIPEIRPEICVGCGACEHACPTRPFRAIYVDGNFEHQVALLPEEEKLEEEPEQETTEEEFPF
jgi:ferredoxin